VRFQNSLANTNLDQMVADPDVATPGANLTNSTALLSSVPISVTTSATNGDRALRISPPRCRARSI